MAELQGREARESGRSPRAESGAGRRPAARPAWEVETGSWCLPGPSLLPKRGLTLHGNQGIITTANS